MAVIVQAGFFIVLLTLHSYWLVQLMRVFFTEHIAPGIQHDGPVDVAVEVDKLLRRAEVVAVVQLGGVGRIRQRVE